MPTPRRAVPRLGASPGNPHGVDVNPMAQRLTGCTRSALLRLSVNYLFRSESTGGLQRLRAAYRGIRRDLDFVRENWNGPLARATQDANTCR